MDESVHVIFCNSFSNPLNAFHMDILEGKVFGGVVLANKIVYDIGVSDALFEGRCIPEIIFLKTEVRRAS
jgi:hypothetical protein